MTANRTPPRANPLGARRDTSRPGFPIPAGACDSHMHIVGPFDRYPLRETRSLEPPESTFADYLEMKRATGIERNVIVQPSFFAKDNACTLDSTERMGEHARAVVVVEPDVDEADISRNLLRAVRNGDAEIGIAVLRASWRCSANVVDLLIHRANVQRTNVVAQTDGRRGIAMYIARYTAKRVGATYREPKKLVGCVLNSVIETRTAH